MQLKTLFNDTPYIFEATMFRDEQYHELLFLIKTDDDILLAEKSGPKFTWRYVGGEKTSFLLREMIFEMLDGAFIEDFLEDERPFDELSNDYYNMLRNSQ